MNFHVSIRRSRLFILFLLNVCLLNAQQEEKSKSIQTVEVMNTLQGDFKWKMIRPSENKVIRTGTKSSDYHLDSLILLSRETFDLSEIEQVALFGYNQKDSLFFSVSAYNVDIGPHLIRGSLHENGRTVEFQENDSTKLFLSIVNRDEYQWTYQIRKNGGWEERDLKIVFSRIKD